MAQEKIHRNSKTFEIFIFLTIGGDRSLRPLVIDHWYEGIRNVKHVFAKIKKTTFQTDLGSFFFLAKTCLTFRIPSYQWSITCGLRDLSPPIVENIKISKVLGSVIPPGTRSVGTGPAPGIIYWKTENCWTSWALVKGVSGGSRTPKIIEKFPEGP